MKTNIIMLVLLFSFVACENDLLDTRPYDAVSSSIIWTNDTNAEMAITGIYRAFFVEFKNYPYYFSRIGGDGADFSGGAIYQDKTDTYDGFFKGRYIALYKIISYANDAIYNLKDNPNITPEKATQWVAEAKFARALSYFYLRNYFGGIIILEQPTDPADTYLPRNTSEQVKELIIRDLTQAITVLPASYGSADEGRFTRAAAIALLGKLYLYDQEFALAKTTFDILMTGSYEFKLVEEYATLFSYKTENNSEVILKVKALMEPGMGAPYDMRYGGRSVNASGWNNSVATWVTMHAYTNTDGTIIDWSTMPKSEDYANQFDYGLDLIPWYHTTFKHADKRLHANVIVPGFTFNGNNSIDYVVNWPYNEHANDAIPAYRTNWTGKALFPWRKYIVEGEENLQRWNSPVDIPLIRYADVKLMYAECVNELEAAAANALFELNDVRNRAGLPNLIGLNQDQLRKEIRMERLREFAGEGVFYFDQKRWKTAHTDTPFFGLNHDVLDFRGEKLWTRAFTDHLYLWPIPQVEIDLNDLLEQNKGW